MTREEIKNQLARDFHNDYSLRGDVVSIYEDAIFYVDKIFNYFESRNCDTCKHYYNIQQDLGSTHGECKLGVIESQNTFKVYSKFSCNKWVAKDE